MRPRSLIGSLGGREAEDEPAKARKLEEGRHSKIEIGAQQEDTV
jgi:hypothetical protein